MYAVSQTSLVISPLVWTEASLKISRATNLYKLHSKAVLRIRIRRIHMFLGLPDPDPLVRDTDPDPNPSIIKQ